MASAAATVPAAQGTVKVLKEGYGFITPSIKGPDIFFFHDDLVTVDFNELKVGDRVQYISGTNSKGPCAKSIELL